MIEIPYSVLPATWKLFPFHSKLPESPNRVSGLGSRKVVSFRKRASNQGDAVVDVREQGGGKRKGRDTQGARQDDLVLVATRIFFGVVGETQEEVTPAGSGVADRNTWILPLEGDPIVSFGCPGAGGDGSGFPQRDGISPLRKAAARVHSISPFEQRIEIDCRDHRALPYSIPLSAKVKL